MFRGSIPKELQFIISQMANGWDSGLIHVGCSGNFTIERMLAPSGRFDFHGNDVTLYSCAIGRYFSGQELRIDLREPYLKEYGFLLPYMDSAKGRLATMLLCSQMLQFGNVRDDGNSGTSIVRNRYYERLQRSYKSCWDELIAATFSRIDAADFRLRSFESGDVVDWCAGLPDGTQFISFPPFFSGDYEQQFKNLSKLFDWDEPDYPEFDEYGRAMLIERVQSFRRWIIGTHIRQEDLEPYLRGLVHTTNRGTGIYVYSNSDDPVTVVAPFQQTAPFGLPPLMKEDDLGDDLRLVPLTPPQFFGLRSQYMNHNIVPGKPAASWAVVSGGKLVGAYAIKNSELGSHNDFASHLPTPDMYMLSDFPVSGSKYSKLAKLVLYAALSKESQELIQVLTSRRTLSLVTSAFTNRPVSMKYRGVFDLLSRKPSKDVKMGKNMLNYGALLGKWTLNEGLAIWNKRHR